jgi:GntR family transcriptional regulator
MTARELDHSGAVPLWQQLQRDLAARVAAREFSEEFPSELALASEYRVSRQTVRQALRPLRAAGVVTGSRGRPSRVAAPDGIDQPLGALYSLFARVEAAGLPIRSKVRTFGIRADGVIAPRLGLEESVPLVYLNRLRLAGDQPLAIDQVWMPAVLAEPLLEADFSKADFYAELARRAGIRLDSGEERINAVPLTDIQRRLLDAPPGTAAFSIRRVGRARGRPVEWRHVLVRGDRFPLTATFAARSGYCLAGTPGRR